MVGECELVGEDDGEVEIEGKGVIGLGEPDGISDGIIMVGFDEIVGLKLGDDEIEGCIEGAKDGASLCSKAP
jgi:hypothetical protein